MRFGTCATSLIFPKYSRMRFRPTSVLVIPTSLPDPADRPCALVGLLTDQLADPPVNYCRDRLFSEPALPLAALAAERDDGPWGKGPVTVGFVRHGRAWPG